MMEKKAVIKVNNLHKSFDEKEVLAGITEEIDEGEVVVVIGPSGSGKSTFLRCLNLLETPDEGEVYIDGEQINAPGVDAEDGNGIPAFQSVPSSYRIAEYNTRTCKA